MRSSTDFNQIMSAPLGSCLYIVLKFFLLFLLHYVLFQGELP